MMFPTPEPRDSPEWLAPGDLLKEVPSNNGSGKSTIDRCFSPLIFPKEERNSDDWKTTQQPEQYFITSWLFPAPKRVPEKKRHFSRPSLVATELHAISAPLGADPHVFDDNLL